MRRLVIMIALTAVLSSGCANMGNGTMFGATTGGLVGGFVSAALQDTDPWVQAAVPIAGTLLGGGIGYAIDSKGAERKEQAEALRQQQSLQMHQAQMQQVEIQKLQERTQLSAPVVLMAGDQALVARNGMELANLLININPGATFQLLTKKANVKSVQDDMKANGYIAIGVPTQQGQNSMLVFQKPQQQATPVSLEQALKML